MIVHNQIEESVIETVAQVFDEIERSGQPDFCSCDQCRLDVSCYVLNRMKPRYVVSERGFTHLAVEHSDQQTADLITLVKEGIERVSHTKRPHFPHRAGHVTSIPAGPCYEFPVISGRAYNGLNFEPLHGVEAELIIAGKTAPMTSPNWQNPMIIPTQAEGHYSFWPLAVEADAPGKRRVFDVNLVIRGQSFEQVVHFFQLSIVSVAEANRTPTSTFSVGALYAFPQ